MTSQDHDGRRERLASIALVWPTELEEALGRSRWTIRRWKNSGHLPPPLPNGAYRLPDIERALDKMARSRKKHKPRGALKREST